MVKKKDVHVVPHKDGGWAIKKEGAKRASKLVETKEPAIKKAREIAKKEKVEVVIHNKDGKISDSDSYGNDPSRIKDKKH